MLQLALNLNKLRDQLPREHRGHYMILGMYQNKINRYFATALIHTDKHGLYIMRAFCGICGVLHQGGPARGYSEWMAGGGAR
mgnify:CR=1 FL=1